MQSTVLMKLFTADTNEYVALVSNGVEELSNNELAELAENEVTAVTTIYVTEEAVALYESKA